ncbi:MAG: polymer-forming cytoskeletal protein [Verrucomicrobiota bacterium]|nr:polymer-forming cytoskeletal protein [Verrucomicrobiota bacterium]
MAAKKPDHVLLACPHCGHQQKEPRTAISTFCKECGRHLHVQEILNPPKKAAGRAPRRKHIRCFECGAELEVPVSAESTMCKRCSAYVDLHDYRITGAVSKNFKTKGTFVVEPKGWVFNTITVAGNAVLRGKFDGKLTAEGSLTIYSTAQVKGGLTAGLLIIPVENHFHWRNLIRVDAAEIAGELAAPLRARGTVLLKSTARVFGDLQAGNLVVEEGAVLVGHLRIGLKES